MQGRQEPNRDIQTPKNKSKKLLKEAVEQSDRVTNASGRDGSTTKIILVILYLP